MARLLEVYEGMIKEAESAQIAEQIQHMFAKYAETAQNLLKDEYGTEFTTEDVESLSRGLMERDSQALEESEKVAEYEAIGRELAHKFADEIKTAAAAGVLEKGMNAVKKTLKTTATVIKRKPLQSAVVAGGGLAVGSAAGAMLAGGDH